MNRDEVLEEYRRALSCSIAHLGTKSVDLDERIMDKLKAADEKIREYGLADTREYRETVERAERDANTFRASLLQKA